GRAAQAVETQASNSGDSTSFSRWTCYCREDRFLYDDTPPCRAQVCGAVLSANLCAATKGSRFRGCNGLADPPRSRSSDPVAQNADAHALLIDVWSAMALKCCRLAAPNRVSKATTTSESSFQGAVHT